MLTSRDLTKWHFVAACLHSLVFAVSFGLAMVHQHEGVVVNNIPVIFWMPMFSGITAIFELTASSHYEIQSRLSRGSAPLRWIEYSITASIMLVAIAQLSTVDHPAVLVFICLSNVLCQFTGYKLESTNHRGWFVLGSLFGILPWIPISVGFFEHLSSVPKFVIAIYCVMLVCFASFPWVAWRYSAGSIHFIEADLWYTGLSLVAKTVLVGLVMGGSLRQ